MHVISNDSDASIATRRVRLLFEQQSLRVDPSTIRYDSYRLIFTESETGKPGGHSLNSTG